ncbi:MULTISPECIES: hypothetical protein [unclassified Sporosarcina]|uniref:hypothetical protein n=1 Tax=unclassified Sporosarcina TaxID=2647733 RepID=UPI000C1651F3|nr:MULTISPECIES: hypothetical protein [unclassified Sporosarcina]PID14806.1 hypothetical protein CSV63_10150 [Sporosarcina sp. P34]PID24850.1 hypothetical protein CSV60_08055 [Sporosarcina sp. P7]
MGSKSKYILGVVALSLLAFGFYNFYNASSQEISVNKVKNESSDNSQTEEKPILTMEATFPSYTFEDLSQEAELIVEGKPTEILDSYMVNGDIPFTKFSFKVDKVHKGDIDSAKEIAFVQDGNSEFVFSEFPLLEINQNYILFLKKSESGNYVIVGGPNGKFDYKPALNIYEAETGEKLDENLNRK